MTEEQTTNLQMLKLPKYSFLFSAILALLIPFIARLPVVPIRGWEWLLDYFPGSPGIYLFSLFNLAPGLAWYAIGRMSKKAPIAFWFSIAVGVGFLLWAHGGINLAASSTAVMALLFIPFYTVAANLLGWLLGLFLHFVVKNERMRLWAAIIFGVIAIFLGTGFTVQKSISIVSRESRFPVITISDLPLVKQQVYSSTSFEQIEVIDYGNFDETVGNEITVLDASSITTLAPITYEVKKKSNFKLEACAGCVHMHPYLVPDGKGSLLVATSNGVSNSSGHLLWKWQTEKFTRIVPLRFSSSQPHFFTYQHNDHVELRHVDGKVLWHDQLPVSQIGRVTISNKEDLPFAVTKTKEMSELIVYNIDGTHQKTIRLPAWASHVEQIDWPDNSHFLIGAGALMGILDSSGEVILKHKIANTSFSPYHGPFGTAVKLSPFAAPYLAVISHGSAGFPRSVLLIFNPEGKLAWQEEIQRIRSIIAVPCKNANREVLLVGGLDGVIEYSLSD